MVDTSKFEPVTVYLHDEVPTIGSGVRKVLQFVGRKWVHLRYPRADGAYTKARIRRTVWEQIVEGSKR